MILKIPTVHRQHLNPVELVGQTNRGHCSSVAAVGIGAVAEVLMVAVVGWRDLWLLVAGPVKVVAVGFVGKAMRNGGSRRLGGPVAELYVNGNGNESVQGWRDCDWDGCGSGDSSDYELDAVEVADGHKHDCNPDRSEMIAISIRIGKEKKKVQVNGEIGESGRELEVGGGGGR